MINLNNETVFVLGAGASSPYGFPLGKDLRKDILELLDIASIQNTYKQRGFKDSHIQDFMRTLKFSEHKTIDETISKRPQFRDIARWSIMDTILRKEVEDNLFNQDNWYSTFFDRLGLNIKDNSLNKLTVITFNYERSLEHYLKTKIEISVPEHEVDICLENYNKIQFIHPHGSFGPLDQLKYGEFPSDEDGLQSISQSLGFVSDSFDESKDFKLAHGAIKNAFKVYIIGFGYDKRTIERIWGHYDYGNQLIQGTVYGIDPNNIEEINRLIPSLSYMDVHTDAKEFISRIDSERRRRGPVTVIR